MRIVGLLAPATDLARFADDCVFPQDVPVRIGGRVVGHTVRVWAEDGAAWAEMEIDDGEELTGMFGT